MGILSVELGKLRTQRQEETERTQRKGKIKESEEGTERKPGSGLKDGLRVRRTRKGQKPREAFQVVGGGQQRQGRSNCRVCRL